MFKDLIDKYFKNEIETTYITDSQFYSKALETPFISLSSFLSDNAYSNLFNGSPTSSERNCPLISLIWTI